MQYRVLLIFAEGARTAPVEFKASSLSQARQMADIWRADAKAIITRRTRSGVEEVETRDRQAS